MDYHKIYTENLKMEELPVQELSTDTMQVISAFIGKDHLSPMYGKIVGFFTYKHDTYRFHFHVHCPNQKSAHLSNKMTEIRKAVNQTICDVSFIEYMPTDFGCKAFWLYISTASLKKEGDTDAFELRKLMQKITDYSQRQEFCKMFRKTDKQALAENPIYKS